MSPEGAMVAEYTAILSEMFQTRARDGVNHALRSYSNSPDLAVVRRSDLILVSAYRSFAES